MPTDPLHQRVFDEVGSRVVTGALSPGDVVNLAEIEAEFGVSRTVAREAMRLLQAYGLIDVRRRVGLIVAPREEWQLVEPNLVRWLLASSEADAVAQELIDLCRALGPEAARRAAHNATPEERARFRRLVTTMRELVDANGSVVGDDYVAAEREFAELFFTVGRSVLISSIGAQAVGVLPLETLLARLRPALDEWVSVYETIADAIWVSDADAAAAAIGRFAEIEERVSATTD